MPQGRGKPRGKRGGSTPHLGKRKGHAAPTPVPVEEEYEPGPEDRAWFAANAGGFLADLQGEALDPLTKLKAARKKEARKPKKEEESSESEEPEYEKKPRKFVDPNEKTEERLPTISREGLVKKIVVPLGKKRQHDTVDLSDEEGGIEAEEDRNTGKNSESAARTAPAPAIATAPLSEEFEELRQYQAAQVNLERLKERVAGIAGDIIENPEENLAEMKKLLALCVGKDPAARRLSFAATCAVWKDIIPGYRIRLPTEAEKDAKVSREVKAQRAFEASFLAFYQKYLKLLEEASMGAPAEKLVALQCMAQLLISHPSFNFRKNMVIALVPFTASNDERQSRVVLDSLCQACETDRTGEVCVEIVHEIAQLLKHRSYNVRPEVFSVFMHVPLSEAQQVDLNDGKGKKDKSKDKDKLSKRQRKEQKARAKLDQDLKEAEAEVSKRDRQLRQTDILRTIMLIYFRVLKKAQPSSPLLEPTLAGLARHAHRISIGFLGDLVVVLQRLLGSDQLSDESALHCALTAFAVLQGDGSALNVDLKEFYTLIYQRLANFNARTNPNLISLMLKCLSHTLLDRRQLSVSRVAAFGKRAAEIAVNSPPPFALALLQLIKTLVVKYPGARELLEVDHTASGTYSAETEDPEHANALAATVWELRILTQHYHPLVARSTVELLNVWKSQSIEKLAEGSKPINVYESHARQYYAGKFFPKVAASNQSAKTKGGYIPSELIEQWQTEAAAMGDAEMTSSNSMYSDIRSTRRTQLRFMKQQLDAYEQYKTSHKLPSHKKR